MKSINELGIKLPEVKSQYKFVNQRQFQVQNLVDRINQERQGTGFKPVTWCQINGRIAHLKDFEFNHFINECFKRSSVGKYFFGCLKKK